MKTLTRLSFIKTLFTPQSMRSHTNDGDNFRQEDEKNRGKTFIRFVHFLGIPLFALSLSVKAAPTGETDLGWGKSATLFFSKTSENFGHLVEAIPAEEGKKMTFHHYDVTDGNIIFKYSTTGDRIKRNPVIRWLLNEGAIYVHHKGFNGKPISTASYSDETKSLVISYVEAGKKTRPAFSYDEIQMSDLNGFQYLVEVID